LAFSAAVENGMVKENTTIVNGASKKADIEARVIHLMQMLRLFTSSQ
jgi:hypothetical protein